MISSVDVYLSAGDELAMEFRLRLVGANPIRNEMSECDRLTVPKQVSHELINRRAGIAL